MRASVEPQKPAMYLNCQHIPLICFIFSLHRFLFHSFIFFFPCLSLSFSRSFSSQWLRSNYNFLPLHTELYWGIAFARWDMQNRTRQHRKRHTNVYFPHERFFAMGFSLLACLKMSLTLVARFAVVSFFSTSVARRSDTSECFNIWTYTNEQTFFNLLFTKQAFNIENIHTIFHSILLDIISRSFHSGHSIFTTHSLHWMHFFVCLRHCVHTTPYHTHTQATYFF